MSDRFEALQLWFLKHRAPIGAILVVVGGIVNILIADLNDPWLDKLDSILTYLGVGVFGAGQFKSDKYHQDK